MLYVEPDFYKDFHCIADRCRHSCCIGWEIDIDDSSYEKYCTMVGRIGDKVRRCIAAEPEPHFVLTVDERCPFLNSDGLCEIILELGEGTICNICREHPRFYHCFPGREERGLGLCCEEAVRLLLKSDQPLRFEVRGSEDLPPDPLLDIRRDLFSILSQQDISLSERFDAVSSLLGTKKIPFDTEHWKSFFLSLERLDESWTAALNSMDSFTEPDGISFERIAEYLLYRHFASSESLEDAALIVQFVYVSLCILASVDVPLEEAVRMFSAEIEYSDENISRILDEIFVLLQEV